MKQTLRIYGCLLGLLLVTAPMLAQSVAQPPSRLELGRKTAPAGTRVIHSRNFPFLKHPAAFGLDRNVVINRNKAINSYYRSLLIAPESPKASARTASPETTATVATTQEVRPVVEALTKSEDRMFVSDKITVSNVYPNPANDIVEVDFQITGSLNEAKVILQNVLGTPLAEYVLERNDRKVRITTRELAAGVYFYTLSLDGNKVATKKLIVRHN